MSQRQLHVFITAAGEERVHSHEQGRANERGRTNEQGRFVRCRARCAVASEFFGSLPDCCLQRYLVHSGSPAVPLPRLIAWAKAVSFCNNRQEPFKRWCLVVRAFRVTNPLSHLGAIPAACCTASNILALRRFFTIQEVARWVGCG